MCLIAFHCGDHPRFRFALAANRDEFHVRASAAAAAREDLPGAIGGRDLEAGGSWLLVAPRGRLAAVTNVRTGRRDSLPHSRGALVDRFLRARSDGAAFAGSLRDEAAGYGPFNLLLWDGAQPWHVGNHPGFHAVAVEPGLHALSNGSLDAPWPKSRMLAAALDRWLDSPAAALDTPDTDPLFAALADRRVAPDAELPATGVPLDWERHLSAAFIVGDDYGTRCSSVVLFDRDGRLHFEERRFGPGGIAEGVSRWRVPTD
jgi:uncharacterized protein with NRDE domain